MAIGSDISSFVSSTIGTTVNDFIDLAIVIVTLMLIWYVIKFFLVGPPTPEDKAAKRDRESGEAEEAKRKRGELLEERRTRKEAAEKIEVQKRREHNMRLPLGNLIHAMTDCTDTVHSLSEGRNAARRVSATGDATRSLHSCNSRLRQAARAVRGALHRERDHTLHEALDNIYRFMGAAEHEIAHINIPNHADPNWVALAATASTQVDHIRAGCDSIRQAIDQYIRDGTQATIAAITAGTPSPGPSGGRRRPVGTP